MFEEQRTHFIKSVQDEEQLLTDVIEEFESITNMLKDRRELCKHTGSLFCALKTIRSRSSSVLDALVNKDSSSIDEENLVKTLRVIELAMQLENEEKPYQAASKDTVKLLKGVKESLSTVNSNISENHAKSQKQSSLQSQQENFFDQCLELFETWTSEETKCSTNHSSYDELKSTLYPVVGKKLKFSHFIPSATLYLNEDPYEEPDVLLDRVIATNNAEISYVYQLTFRYYSTPLEQFVKLCSRFCYTPDEYEKKEPAISKQQSLVLDFLQTWIENFGITDISSSVSRHVRFFVNEIVIPAG